MNTGGGGWRGYRKDKKELSSKAAILWKANSHPDAPTRKCLKEVEDKERELAVIEGLSP